MPDKSTQHHSAVLQHPGGELQLPIRNASKGAPGFEIGKLLAKSGLVTYDPGFVQHRRVLLDDHLHRRRRRDPALPRLPDRPAGRERPPSSRSATC